MFLQNSDLESPYLVDSGLTIFHPWVFCIINLQSILSKTENFWEMLDNYTPDIDCEIWLNSSILDNEITPNNCKLYQKNRDDIMVGY